MATGSYRAVLPLKGDGQPICELLPAQPITRPREVDARRGIAEPATMPEPLWIEAPNESRYDRCVAHGSLLTPAREGV